MIFQGKPATHLLQHPILSRPFVTTVRYCRQSKDNEGEPAERPEYPEKPEGQKGYVPKEVDWQTSVEYMNSTGKVCGSRGGQGVRPTPLKNHKKYGVS